jgi:AcrR family transcriptional regulator
MILSNVPRDEPRPYDASKRREKATEAGARILAAASELFAAHGLEAVSLAQVAEKAGVSAATVYARYRSKAGLLEALTHSVLLGPQYRADAATGPHFDDPVQALRATARIARGIYEREHRDLAVVRAAAAYSPALKDVEAKLEALRRDLQAERAALVYRAHPALAALGLEKVRDLIWAFTGRDLYRMLVVERGWTPDEYENWLGETLIGALCPTTPDAKRGPRDR